MHIPHNKSVKIKLTLQNEGILFDNAKVTIKKGFKVHAKPLYIASDF